MSLRWNETQSKKYIILEGKSYIIMSEVLFFLRSFFFLNNLRFIMKFKLLKKDIEISPIAPPISNMYIASHIINFLHQRGTSVPTDELTLAHYNHPKSEVYMISLWVLCILYVWTHVWHVSLIMEWYRIFTALNILFAFPINSPAPMLDEVFIVSVVLHFPECHILGIK